MNPHILRPLLLAALVGLPLATLGVGAAPTAGVDPLAGYPRGSVLMEDGSVAIPLRLDSPAEYTPEVHKKVLAASEKGMGYDYINDVEVQLATNYLFIRPGAWMWSPSWCTMNFIYGTPGSYKIGSAGHCNHQGQDVTILAANPGVLVKIGRTTAHRDNGPGDDWSIVTIDSRWQNSVDANVADIGGPQGGKYTGPGQTPGLVTKHFGHGLAIGTGGTPRAGHANLVRDTYWSCFCAATPGDSGSAMLIVTPDAPLGKGLGVLTHLVAGSGGPVGGTLLTAVPEPLRNGDITPLPPACGRPLGGRPPAPAPFHRFPPEGLSPPPGHAGSGNMNLRSPRAIILAILVLVPATLAGAAGLAAPVTADPLADYPEGSYVMEDGSIAIPLKGPADPLITPDVLAKVEAASVKGMAYDFENDVEVSMATQYLFIRPGSWMRYPNWCTMNFIYGTPGNYKIGSAGHCNPTVNTPVVIYAYPSLLVGIGDTIAAHNNGVGDDWSIAQIRPQWQGYVDANTAVIGGPQGGAFTGDIKLTSPQAVKHFGHGIGVGTGGTPRAGEALKTGTRDWYCMCVAAPGDSGSAMLLAGSVANPMGQGLGVLTHLVLVNTGGVVAGTRLTVIPYTIANGDVNPLPPTYP